MDRHTKVVKKEEIRNKPKKPSVDNLALVNDAMTGMENNFYGQSRSFRTHVLNTLLEMNERLSRLETGG